MSRSVRYQALNQDANLVTDQVLRPDGEIFQSNTQVQDESDNRPSKEELWQNPINKNIGHGLSHFVSKTLIEICNNIPSQVHVHLLKP